MKLIIHEAAEQSIVRQIEWYAEQGLPEIARRFHGAVLSAIDALAAMPEAGAPKFFASPRLAGLRSWPVDGFGEFRVYYLVHPELLAILNILHGKRDADQHFRDRTDDR